ncbi:DPBB and LysM peptidoglycan-binding domain-containing protein [Cyclobacterium jeungdonense]|uniref:LysM peptidoglycan-binding domain-containing protein n=1 Tax=Cyclobacterium jeungdonense TaxID=708087 RepID=A0ABT8C5R2_9BACT|nr:LysM peptidoglycan-binding domain-containing protein [Cyclobacterium jeungdonense]MDN3688133.1 LysM peptidoglycan-binding domain-containing protein [Cyclobacterium jeungdonense]
MKCWILILGMISMAIPSRGSVLTKIDSVGIERIGGKSYIIHQVEPQETLFGISRRYNTPVGDIVQSNDNLKAGLKIGQRIRVPFVEKLALPAGAKLHQVIPGETLFSIAQKYDSKVEDLMAWNELKGSDISVGQSLIIKGLEEKQKPVASEKIEETVEMADQTVAVTNEAVTPAPDNSNSKTARKPEKAPKENRSASNTTTESKPLVSTTGNWISHRVVQGETLFSIAQKYDSKVEDLIQWNGLSSNNLRIGQTLKVGRETNAQIPVSQLPGPSRPVNPEPSASTTTPNRPAPDPGGATSVSNTPSNVGASTAFKNVTESGQAEVIEGTGNHKKYLVLHRTAPVGTIMRIRNEENDVTVFARVVGVLPETGDNNRLIIKVSKAAFDQLKAVNSRFRVEVAY